MVCYTIPMVIQLRGFVRALVFERDGRLCVHCGSAERPTVDHIVPVARGGTDALVNLQVLCSLCNSSKANFDWDEWRKVQHDWREGALPDPSTLCSLPDCSRRVVGGGFCWQHVGPPLRRRPDGWVAGAGGRSTSIYLSKQAQADLDALTRRWAIGRSQAIALAMRRAIEPDDD